MRKLIEAVLAHPGACFVAVALAAGSFVPGLFKTIFDTSSNMLVVHDDPDKTFYNETREAFGDDVILSVVIRADDIFTIPILASIERMTGDAESLPGVTRVVSLSTVSDIRGEDGLLETDYLLPYVPESPEEVAEIRENALGSEIFRGEVISADGRASAINVFVADDPEDLHFQRKLVDAIQAMIDRELDSLGSGIEIYQTGIPRVKVSMIRAIERDIALLLPISFVVVFGLIFAIYRRLAAVAIPLVTGTASVIITVGFMGYLGIPMNPITSIIPILLVVIGATEDIHLIRVRSPSRAAPVASRLSSR